MPSTTDGQFATLRDLVLHHAGRRGWSTQRHIAVACGLDETALSRFLDGRQDIGAVRTYALFREIGIPVERYPLAFELLDRSQRLAREIDGARRAVSVAHRTGMDEADAPLPAAPSPPPTGYIRATAIDGTIPVGMKARAASQIDGVVQELPLLAFQAGQIAVESLSAGEAARLFAAEGLSGEAIAAFFGDRP
jgi:hypothetical protein